MKCYPIYRVLCIFNVYFLLTINVRRTVYLRIYLGLPTFFVNVFFQILQEVTESFGKWVTTLSSKFLQLSFFIQHFGGQ